MSRAGAYLYGFTERSFQPPPDLRGLRGAPVEVIGFADLAAVVSDHPVQPLMPARRNVEPHHRVVGQVSSQAALVPAAFGHVGGSQADILAVLRGNYDAIRQELARVAGKSEMGMKVTWNVDNIYTHLVKINKDLREARDRVFRGRAPSMNEKLQLGAQFEASLKAERERVTSMILAPFQQIASDVFHTPPRNEKTICHMALLVERDRPDEFQAALRQAAMLFDASMAFESTGPWPPYSFVRLRLRSAA